MRDLFGRIRHVHDHCEVLVKHLGDVDALVVALRFKRKDFLALRLR